MKKINYKKIFAILGGLTTLIALFSFFTGYSSIIDFYKRHDTYKINIINKHLTYATNKILIPETGEDELGLTSNIIIDISYPYIKYPDNTYIQNKINKLIKKTFKDGWDVDLTNIDKTDWYGEVHASHELKYKIQNLLGITLEIYAYSTGAAHGNKTIIPLNINLKNGEFFEFKDIFRSWAFESVNSLVKKRLKDHPSYEFIFERIDVTVRNDQSFYLQKESFYIVFDKYEIAAGAAGPIELELPIKDIKEFINPNGPLSLMM